MTRDSMIEQWRIAMYPHIDAPTFAAHLADTTSWLWSEIDALVKIAALSRPAPPDDLVALVREWQRVVRAYQDCTKDLAVLDVQLGRVEAALLAWAATAPVAAPAPETPHLRGGGIVCHTEIETPAPDAMPERCPKCHGKGYKFVGYPHYDSDPCAACNGTGRRQEAQP